MSTLQLDVDMPSKQTNIFPLPKLFCRCNIIDFFHQNSFIMIIDPNCKKSRKNIFLFLALGDFLDGTGDSIVTTPHYIQNLEIPESIDENRPSVSDQKNFFNFWHFF